MIFIVAVFLTQTASSFLQQNNQWTPQASIPEYKIFTEEPPFLIADQNRVIHAFNSQSLESNVENSPQAVFYRQWTLNGGWTNPIDIIINPTGGNLELVGVYLDDEGIIHLAVQMDSEQIYYSQAPLSNAGQISSWSSLKLIAPETLPIRRGIPIMASISGDGNGKLVLVFSGLENGNGLFWVYSQDSGSTWSQPSPVYFTDDEKILVVYPRLFPGESGLLHLVFSTFNDDGSGGPGYYSQLDFMNMEWGKLVEIDQPGIRTPSVIELADDIIVSYYHKKNNANWWRRSADGGETWTHPARLSPSHKGTNGVVSFAIDGSDTLHAFFGQRIDDNNHGMWHTVWIEDGWSSPEPIVRGPQVRDEIGGRGFDPRSANAVVSNGNMILATWGTDGAAGENGAWYSYSFLDTPELPLVPLPTPKVTQSSNLNIPPQSDDPEPLPSPIPTPIPDFQTEQSTLVPGNPSLPLLVGLVSVLLLLSLPVIIRLLIRSGRFH